MFRRGWGGTYEPTCSLFMSHTVLVFGVLEEVRLGAAPVSYAFTPSYQIIMRHSGS